MQNTPKATLTAFMLASTPPELAPDELDPAYQQQKQNSEELPPQTIDCLENVAQHSAPSQIAPSKNSSASKKSSCGPKAAQKTAAHQHYQMQSIQRSMQRIDKFLRPESVLGTDRKKAQSK